MNSKLRSTNFDERNIFLNKIVNYFCLFAFFLVSCGSLDSGRTPASVNEGKEEKDMEEVDMDGLDLIIIPEEIVNFSRDGDVRITSEDINQYWSLRSQIDQNHHGRVNSLDNFSFVFGNNQEQTASLKYAIDFSSFQGNNDEYHQIQDEFYQAREDWENLCGVSFFYRPEMDERIENGVVPEETFFIIERSQTNYKGFFASAFYPFSHRQNRRIILYPKFFEFSCKRRLGILRHEIGHILGFAHEQKRSYKDCEQDGSSAEDNDLMATDYIAFGPYDSLSIMHYNCDGEGPDNNEFSAQDSISALMFFPKR